MESPNLASGFQSSSYFILYPYIKTTSHPITTPTLPPYYYPHPPTLLLPPVILLSARKKLLKTGQILGIRNVYTHSVIASEQMNNWYKFCLHSCRHWEVITQWFLKIAISPNKALCVEALFCQIQSHLQHRSLSNTTELYNHTQPSSFLGR